MRPTEPLFRRLSSSALAWDLLQCVLSGVLLALSFPKLSLFPLAWVGLLPLLSFIVGCPTWKRLLLGHFIFGVSFFTVLLYWIPAVLSTFGGFPLLPAVLSNLLLAFFLTALLSPFSLLTYGTTRVSPRLALLCAPGFWILPELVRSEYPFGGFPWGLLGYSQSPDLYLIQTADIGGVYLVSYLVVAVNCGLLLLLRHRVRSALAGFGTLFVLAHLYGIYRVHVWEPRTGPPLKTALVQPEIALSGDLKRYRSDYYARLPGFYRRAVRAGAQWVIFPEAQNPFFFGTDRQYTNFWKEQVKNASVPLLFNSSQVGSVDPRRYFNGAFLLDSQGREAYQYHKMRLVPFGEYVPLGPLRRFFQPLVKEVPEFVPGTEMTVGSVGETRFATLICFEAIFPSLSRRAVEAGAQVIVNITNDSWYGDTAAPYQHFEQATFRAIETRRPLLRAANTGITARIDPRGRVMERLEPFRRGLLITEVRGVSVRSIYSVGGEWLNISLVACSVLAWLLVSRARPGNGHRKV